MTNFYCLFIVVSIVTHCGTEDHVLSVRRPTAPSALYCPLQTTFQLAYSRTHLRAWLMMTLYLTPPMNSSCKLPIVLVQ